MIVYAKSAEEFVADVDSNRVVDEILRRFEHRHRMRPGRSELSAWGNSMQFMASRVRGARIPGDAGVAIEFTIPLTSRRVDFIVSGVNADGQDVAVIVELKQWSDAEATGKDAVVCTRLGRRAVEVAHPSYQAWTYAALIQDYNETVRIEKIGLHACAYLHNMRSGSAINDPRYKEHLARAPSFLAADADLFSEFLSRHIRSGDHNRVMYRIEHGQLRPSRSLADVLAGMIDGNPEFFLIDEQKVVYETALALADQTRSEKRVLIVHGGPGTGKSVVAVNLLVELTRRGKLVQYVSRNAAPREVYAARLQGHRTKTQINSMFRGSGSFVETPTDFFDVLVVDEAHRLNEKSGRYGNLGEHQVRELINAARLTIFFLDEDQRVTLRDVGTDQTIREWAAELGARVERLALPSQFRCNGSDGYIAFLDDALGIRETANPTISADMYDFRVFDDPNALWDTIRALNAASEHDGEPRNKSRLVAGYCWPWASKRHPQTMDIVLPEYGFSAQWNLASDGPAWIIGAESVEQVGCIHTCQGLELDYVGVIVGPDLVARNNRLLTRGLERASQDQSVKGLRKRMKEDPDAAEAAVDPIIRNTYRTLMSRGMKGCFVFCTDAETREYFRNLITQDQDDAGFPEPTRSEILKAADRPDQ